MPDIKIDMSVLERLKGELSAVREEFSNAEQFGGELAGAVGHRQLASTVDDFASAWSVHRQHILARLTFVLDGVTAIHDTFEELDSRLATQADKLDDYLSPAATPESANGEH